MAGTSTWHRPGPALRLFWILGQSSRQFFVCCLCVCTGNGWFHPVQRQSEVQAGCFLSVYTLLGSDNLNLCRELWGSKRCWSRHSVQTGVFSGPVTGKWLEPQVFSICILYLVLGSKQVGTCALLQWSLHFLEPFYKSHWLSNQLKGLIFPLLDCKAGVPICGMKIFPLSPGKIPEPMMSPPLLCPLLGVWVPSWLCLLSCFVPVFSLFSERAIPSIDVSSYILMGEYVLSVLYSSFLI